MNHQTGLKFTLAISKQEILRCLIGTKVRDAYDATVQESQDDENSSQGIEKAEDLAKGKDKKHTVFSDLRKQSYLLPYTSEWNPMPCIKY
jgi:hypothetical protein